VAKFKDELKKKQKRETERDVVKEVRKRKFECGGQEVAPNPKRQFFGAVGRWRGGGTNLNSYLKDDLQKEENLENEA
jgi:hypothetical protein